MALNVTGLLQSLGVNVGAVETKATNFLLKKAAEWARVPTRIARVNAAINIVGGAATQRNKLDVVAAMTAAEQGISRIQSVYDGASGDVADVVETVRTLRPGQMPPVEIVPKAVKVAGSVTAVLQGLTTIESAVMANARKTLTPDELKKLQGGVSFGSFMGGAMKQLLIYAAFGIPIYLIIRGKAGRGRYRW